MTVLNVRDFGAVGDGVTDDTQAIQDAIDQAVDGDTVLIPETTDHYLMSENSRGNAFYMDETVSDITITGEGPGSYLKLDDVRDDSYVNMFRFDCRGDPFALEIRNLKISTSLDVNTRIGREGHAGIYLVAEGQYDAVSGFDFRFEDILLEDMAGVGFGFWGGVDTVKANRITVDTTDDQHAFQLGSATTSHDESDVVNEFTSLKALDVGSGDATIGNGISVNRSILVEDFYVDTAYAGNKFSGGGGGYAYVRNGTFTGDSNANSLFRDSVNRGGPWGVELDRIVFRDTDSTGGLRCGGRDQHVGTWDVGELEFRNLDRNDTRNETIYVTENAVFDGGTVHIDTVPHNGIAHNSENAGSLDTLNQWEVDGSPTNDFGGANFSVGSVNEQASPGLDVPAPDEVGAWSAETSTDEEEPAEEPVEEDTEEDAEESDSFEEWTPRWASDVDEWGVVSGDGFDGGHALQYEHSGTDPGRHAISWDAVGEPSDVEVLDKFRVPAFNEAESSGYHARVHLRSSARNGNETGYWIELESPAEGFRLAKYNDDGTLTTMERFGTPEEDTFFYRRFRAEGDRLQAKVWPVTEPEPAEWTVEHTDSDHTDGWVGLGSYDVDPVETDVFSAAVGGETAELSPGGEPTVAWQSPTAGRRVGGTVSVRLSAADGTGAQEGLTVEYRVGDGAWSGTTYDAETGTYVGQWDSTATADGEVALEARVTDDAGSTAASAIDVIVDNRPEITSLVANEATVDGATLNGDLTSLGGSDEVTVWFEYRPTGTDAWDVAGERTLSEPGEFSRVVSGLEAGTEYEHRAVAQGDGGPIDGGIVRFDTLAAPEASSAPSVDRFDVTDQSGQEWTRFDVDWTVSDAENDLDAVVTTLEYGGRTVAAQSTRVNGDTASYTHVLRVRGDVDTVSLWVNDTSNDTASESIDV